VSSTFQQSTPERTLYILGIFSPYCLSLPGGVFLYTITAMVQRRFEPQGYFTNHEDHGALPDSFLFYLFVTFLEFRLSSIPHRVRCIWPIFSQPTTLIICAPSFVPLGVHNLEIRGRAMGDYLAGVRVGSERFLLLAGCLGRWSIVPAQTRCCCRLNAIYIYPELPFGSKMFGMPVIGLGYSTAYRFSLWISHWSALKLATWTGWRVM
jgi:hypothetical protein